MPTFVKTKEMKYIYSVLVICSSYDPQHPHEILYPDLTKERAEEIVMYYDTLETNKTYNTWIDSVEVQ